MRFDFVLQTRGCAPTHALCIHGRIDLATLAGIHGVEAERAESLGTTKDHIDKAVTTAVAEVVNVTVDQILRERGQPDHRAILLRHAPRRCLIVREKCIVQRVVRDAGVGGEAQLARYLNSADDAFSGRVNVQRPRDLHRVRRLNHPLFEPVRILLVDRSVVTRQTGLYPAQGA